MNKTQKWFAITACILFIGLAYLPVVQSDNEEPSVIALGKTIYVDDDGGGDYINIQDAINASSEGDTILSLIHI